MQEARFWGVSPMEIINWPVEWITKGRIVREAEAIAHKQMSNAR